MIFDMTRRVSGGGGGPTASDAILTVTVPTGSTVTMTKGGVTLTPTMWVQAADNTLDCALFVIGPSLFDAQNAWTVTASLSGDTASATVTIDSNEQYDLELSYHVPSGYQEVEYLASSGTQYIFTGVAPKDVTRIDCDFMATSVGSFVYAWGSYNGSQESSMGKLHSADSYIRAYLNGKEVASAKNIAANTLYKTITRLDTFSVDGDSYQMTGTLNQTNSLQIVLFARNVNSGADLKMTGRIYYAAFYNGNTLVDEMFPCYRVSDSVAGMWGRISNTFYTNQGTGTFTVDPDV